MKQIKFALVAAFVLSAITSVAFAEEETKMILNKNNFKHYITKFNSKVQELHLDVVPGTKMIKNSDAWKFLQENIPFFECPDKEIEEIYYFRWWTYRKHIKSTEDGFVITEFLPKVGWSKKHNTINCPVGHHFYEGRWIHAPKYLDDYSIFWFRKGGAPGGVCKCYSCWLPDAIYARYLVTLDKALTVSLLDDMVKNWEAWGKEGLRLTKPMPTRLLPNGLYWQIDSWDGMEFSAGGSGARPTINSYMYGDAVAISNIAALAGDEELAEDFRQRAAKLKNVIQGKLWDKKAQFFKTRAYDNCRSNYGWDPRHPNDTLVPVREEIGFIPWYFNLPDAEYSAAWKQLTDPRGFWAAWGITTAEQRHKRFDPGKGGCRWNGPVWPFATTQTLVALANLLNNYRQDYVTNQDYFDALKTYARSQHKADRPWIGENLSVATGRWLVNQPRSKDYNHSAYCDLVITGLVGLRPRADDTLEVNPLVPDGVWDYFCLDNVLYHGRIITILWDKTGNKYNRGKGLRVFANGKEIVQSKTITRIMGKLPPIRQTITIQTKSLSE